MDLKKADKLYDKLYNKYGKPLEKDHWGDYLAISENGKTILGKEYLKVAKRALVTFGPGNFLYKIGERAIGKWRTIF